MKSSNQPSAALPTIGKQPSPSGSKFDWINTIEQWRTSGLSQSAYCRLNNINYQQFTYHRYKHNTKSKVKPKLIPVKMVPNHSPTSSLNHLILDYPSGIKLSIPMDVDPIALKALLSCLEIH